MQLVPSKILVDRACPAYQTASTAAVSSSSPSSSSSSSPSSAPPPSTPAQSPFPPPSSTPSSYISFSPNEPEFTTPTLPPAVPTTTPITTTTTPPSRPTLKRMPTLQSQPPAEVVVVDHDTPGFPPSPPPPPPSPASSRSRSSSSSSSPSSSEPPSAWVPLPLHFKRTNTLLSTDSSSALARISRASPRTAVRGRVKSVDKVVKGGYGGADGLWSVSDDGSGDEDEEGEGDGEDRDEGLAAGVKRILGTLTKKWWWKQRDEEDGDDDEVVEECCIHSGAEARVDRFQELLCRGCLRRERGCRLKRSGNWVC